MSKSKHDPLSVILLVRDTNSVQVALHHWLTSLRTLDRRFELVLVTDLPDIELEGVEVVPLAPWPGEGAAVRAGVERSTHSLLLLAGSDYQYAPTDMQVLLVALERDYSEIGEPIGLVNGCRPGVRVPGWFAAVGEAYRFLAKHLLSYPVDPAKAYYGGRAWRYGVWAWLMFGVRVDDIHSSLKLIRREVYDRLALQSVGPFVWTEILAKSNFMTTLMDEVVLTPVSGATVQVPPWDVLRADARTVVRRPEFARAPDGAFAASK